MNEMEILKEFGRRRLKAGLPEFPPPGIGDLEEILMLRKKLASLESWLGKSIEEKHSD